MSAMLSRLRRSERGQAIVETALVLPVIMLLLLMMLDGGRVFHAWIVVTNGAREGARAAVIRDDLLTINDKLQQAMPTVVGGTWGFNVCPCPGYDDPLVAPSGDPVTVDVTADVVLVTPLIADLFGGSPFRVSASATMQLE